MIYYEELKLHLSDAKMSFERLSAKPSIHWTDWYAEYVTNNGLRIDRNELSALMREADVAYRTNPEQSSWLNFICEFIFNQQK